MKDTSLYSSLTGLICILNGCLPFKIQILQESQIPIVNFDLLDISNVSFENNASLHAKSFLKPNCSLPITSLHFLFDSNENYV